MSASYLIPEPHPNPHRPNLLVYSSCHTHGIMRYLNEHRPEVRGQYNLSAAIVHIALDSKVALQDRRFMDAFHNADFLLYHPLHHEKWKGLRPDEIGLKPSCLRVSMESPQFSAAWPLHSVGTGEMPVRHMVKMGFEEGEIIRAFDSGGLDPMFDVRFKEDCERMRERDLGTDLKGSDFVEFYFKKQKMFFTPNHPTMPVLGFMVDQFLGKLGHPEKGALHALGLPLKTDEGDNHYPETRYEFNHYGFEYPRRYEHNMGGKEFYHREIARICEA